MFQMISTDNEKEAGRTGWCATLSRRAKARRSLPTPPTLPGTRTLYFGRLWEPLRETLRVRAYVRDCVLSVQVSQKWSRRKRTLPLITAKLSCCHHSRHRRDPLITHLKRRPSQSVPWTPRSSRTRRRDAYLLVAVPALPHSAGGPTRTVPSPPC